MRAILIKTDETVEEIEIKDYTDYYKFGEFDLFDVVYLKWGQNLKVNVIVDDEGMLKQGNLGRRVMGYDQPLFGNIIITGDVDEEGGTLPLTDLVNESNVDYFVSPIMYKLSGEWIMIQVIIKRKQLFRIVDISSWNSIQLNKFLNAYMDRKDYSIEFRRVVE